MMVLYSGLCYCTKLSEAWAAGVKGGQTGVDDGGHAILVQERRAGEAAVRVIAIQRGFQRDGQVRPVHQVW